MKFWVIVRFLENAAKVSCGNIIPIYSFIIVKQNVCFSAFWYSSHIISYNGAFLQSEIFFLLITHNLSLLGFCSKSQLQLDFYPEYFFFFNLLSFTLANSEISTKGWLTRTIFYFLPRIVLNSVIENVIQCYLLSKYFHLQGHKFWNF